MGEKLGPNPRKVSDIQLKSMDQIGGDLCFLLRAMGLSTINVTLAHCRWETQYICQNFETFQEFLVQVIFHGLVTYFSSY